MNDKTALRRRFSALRDGLPAEERTSAEEAVRSALFSLPAWRDAPLVCGYMSVRGELNTLPILSQAVAEGKIVALPVIVSGAKEGRMLFRALPDGDLLRLAPARFGIPEPDESCPTLTLQDFSHALILVPALAFDGRGYRLGYGGGYYDRFLSSLAEAEIPVTTVVLTFSVCRADTLPREPHDMPVDLIMDERRITVTHGTHEAP